MSKCEQDYVARAMMCGRSMFRRFQHVCVCSFAREEERSRLRAPHKKVTFNFDDDSEGEDVEDIFGGKGASSAKSEAKSSFEKRQEKVTRF